LNEVLTASEDDTDEEEDFGRTGELDWLDRTPATKTGEVAVASRSAGGRVVSKTGLRSSLTVGAAAAGNLSLKRRNVKQYYPANRAFFSDLPHTVQDRTSRGLGRGLTERDVAQFIQLQAGVAVDPKRINLPWDAHANKLKGFAYVALDQPAHLLRVCALNGASFHGKNIVVTVAANPIVDSGPAKAETLEVSASRTARGMRPRARSKQNATAVVGRTIQFGL
jgi:hypothetical protein